MNLLLPADIVPSHAVATWLLSTIDNLLNDLGLSRDHRIEEIIYFVTIVAMAFAVSWLLKVVILFISRKMMKLSSSNIAHDILRHHLLSRVSHVIPPLVALGLLPFAFASGSTLLHILEKLIFTYTMIVVAVALCAVLNFVWSRFVKKENTKNLPLGGILNLCKGIVWIIVVIITISLLVNKSPASLLAGLGAFAAVLSLVFKDTILGFVAGIQLAENDMLRVGDWIVVPSTIANGICIDVSLTAVKVQNWDNTIVTLPPYTLVSTSFQNWRGMSESGYRLISSSLYIDAESVVTATPELIAAVKPLPGMTEFVERIEKQGQFYDPGVACVNGTLNTNLGLFRAYICYYLLHHPLIGTTQQILVNIKAPTPNGLPLQIYCYTTTAWTAYEAVMSDIFEQITATAPRFGIAIFNAPAGADINRAAMSIDGKVGAVSNASTAPLSGPAKA